MRDENDNGGYGTFHRYFPRATLNAAVSRQLSKAAEFYHAEVEAGWDGDIVIFELGSNGAATESQVNAMIELVPPEKTVFVVNVRTPFPLQDVNNELLSRAAEAYDNVSLIDWFSYSAGHDEWFEHDGTHLKPSGCEKYMDMIQASLVAHYEKEAALEAAEGQEELVRISWGPLAEAASSEEGDGAA